jgi:hypothetical protein
MRVINATTGKQQLIFTETFLEYEKCGDRFNFANKEEYTMKGIQNMFCFKPEDKNRIKV